MKTMKTMKTWIAIAIATLLALGCGGAEVEQKDFLPSEEADYSGYEDSDIGALEQAIAIPNGYGMILDTNGNPCFVTSDYCLIPRDKKIRPKVTTDINFAAGFTLKSQVELEVASVCSIVLTPRGWDCAYTTGSSNEPIHSGTCSGTYGCMVPGSVNSQVYSANGIFYKRFNSCDIKLNKSGIESTATYAAADINGKKAFVRRIIKHELGHCVGLPHNTTGVMNGSDTSASFTSAELSYLNDYVP